MRDICYVGKRGPRIKFTIIIIIISVSMVWKEYIGANQLINKPGLRGFDETVALIR